MTADLQWCFEQIEHRGIYRCPNGELMQGSTPVGVIYWQFYLRRCMFNPVFTNAVAHHLLERLPSTDVQFAGVETSGTTLAYALAQASGTPMLGIRKQPKPYGLTNFTEGRITGKPLVIVDDLIGSGSTLHRAHLTLKSFNLNVSDQHVVIVDKTDMKAPPRIDVPGVTVNHLFKRDQFALRWDEYVERYGQDPNFGPHY